MNPPDKTLLPCYLGRWSSTRTTSRSLKRALKLSPGLSRCVFPSTCIQLKSPWWPITQSAVQNRAEVRE